MHKKGQAAMEFLMTYGWAILAAIIAIGVLAYFGVFSPGKYTTGSTVVNPPFYANAWNIQSTGGGAGNINIEFKNNGGEDYNITSVALSNLPSGANCTGDSNVESVSAKGTVTAQMPCTTGLTVGQSFKADLSISYTKTGSTLTLTSTGTIADKVTA